MKYLLILSVVILMFACDHPADKTAVSSPVSDSTLGIPAYFDTTGFSTICNNVAYDLKHAGHGDYFTISVSNGTYIDRDSLARLVQSFIAYDIKDSNLCSTYIKTCPGLKIISWKMNSPAAPTQIIERLIFKSSVTNPEYKVTNKISITDFTIRRSITPRLIKLRIVNNRTIEEVVIDSIYYHPLSESRLTLLNTIEEELDTRKKNCGE